MSTNVLSPLSELTAVSTRSLEWSRVSRYDKLESRVLRWLGLISSTVVPDGEDTTVVTGVGLRIYDFQIMFSCGLYLPIEEFVYP